MTPKTLVIDIGGTKLEVGIVASDGSILERRRTLSTGVADAEELFARLAGLIDEVAAHGAMGSVSVCGVGCGGPMRIAGEAVSDDLRAEVELLRAELDMLKRAFRRHCLETA